MLNRHPTYSQNPTYFGQSIGSKPKLVASTSRDISQPSPRVVGCAWVSSKPAPSYAKENQRTDLISLAYAELYLTTAALVRHFDFELGDSSIKNITMYRDYALSFDEDYNYGSKFTIRKVLHEG
jgi:hypothetical protein